MKKKQKPKTEVQFKIGIEKGTVKLIIRELINKTKVKKEIIVFMDRKGAQQLASVLLKNSLEPTPNDSSDGPQG